MACDAFCRLPSASELLLLSPARPSCRIQGLVLRTIGKTSCCAGLAAGRTFYKLRSETVVPRCQQKNHTAAEEQSSLKNSSYSNGFRPEHRDIAKEASDVSQVWVDYGRTYAEEQHVRLPWAC